MPFLPILVFASLLSPECPAGPVAQPAVRVVTSTTAADSTVRVAVCVHVPAGRSIGSYHGELTFAPSEARLLRVERTADGMHAENTTLEGTVNFAAAAPSGIGSGTLITLVLVPRAHGAMPRVSVCLLELNDTRGESLLPPDPCGHS